MNAFYGQIKGPFTAGEDIFAKISAKMTGDNNTITSIGIQAGYKDVVVLNGNSFELGKPALLQFDDVAITSLSFENDVDENAIIDFIYE